MELSILDSIKKLLGIEKDYEHFDIDIILNINSAFMILNQLGVGPADGFAIQDNKAAWADFVQDHKDIESVKLYVYHRTRLAFDPPQMGYLVDAINKQLQELEWRLNVQVDSNKHS